MHLICQLQRVYWRVYSLYRSIDEVGRKFVYTESSFQFESPWLSEQLGGPMFRDALSPQQHMQVAAVDRQMWRVVVVIAVCGAIGVFAFVWDLVRHGA